MARKQPSTASPSGAEGEDRPIRFDHLKELLTEAMHADRAAYAAEMLADATPSGPAVSAAARLRRAADTAWATAKASALVWAGKGRNTHTTALRRALSKLRAERTEDTEDRRAEQGRLDV